MNIFISLLNFMKIPNSPLKFQAKGYKHRDKQTRKPA